MTAQATVPAQVAAAAPCDRRSRSVRSPRPPADPASRADFSSLSDRMSYLLVLRLAMGAIIAIWAVLRPEALVVPLQTLGALDRRLPR